MTQEEEIEFDRLKVARDFLLLTVANLRGQLETIAAKEREACAKLLDEEALDAWTFDDSLARATEIYAELIRARGEA